MTAARMTDGAGPIDGQTIENLLSGVEAWRGLPRSAFDQHKTSARTVPSNDWRPLVPNTTSLAPPTPSAKAAQTPTCPRAMWPSRHPDAPHQRICFVRILRENIRLPNATVFSNEGR